MNTIHRVLRLDICGFEQNPKAKRELEKLIGTKNIYWAVVVEQLVERSLPTPEIHGSNPAMSKIYMYYRSYCIEKIKIAKRVREWTYF